MNLLEIRRSAARLFTLLPALASLTPWARAAEVIQVDVRGILNARSVTTLTQGRLVPWTVGVDGNGLADGYMTREASLFQGDRNPRALPGDGLFPATATRPQVRLNYSNVEGSSSQTRAIHGPGNFRFSVPRRRYGRMILFFTSAEGPSPLAIILSFGDGTQLRREYLLPDYYTDAPLGDRNVFALVSNLAKWDSRGRMAEAGHHNIHGIDTQPDPMKVLEGVEVVKNTTSYLVFWGATGVTSD